MTKKNVVIGYASVNGGKLYYEIAGEGEAVLFIHGLFLDSRLWEHQFEELSKQYKVIRFDARGFGNTEIDEEPFANYDDIKELINYLQVDQVHVVGLSLGGQLALEFAVMYPEHVQSLTLCSYKLVGEEESEQFKLEKSHLWKTIMAGDIEASVALNESMWLIGHSTANQIREQEKALYREMVLHNLSKPMIDRKPIFVDNLANKLNKVEARTLILYGKHDYIDYEKAAQKLHNNIEHSSIIRFDQSAHMLNLSEPTLFNHTLLNFISSQ